MTLLRTAADIVGIVARASPGLARRIVAWQVLAAVATVVQFLALHRLVAAFDARLDDAGLARLWPAVGALAVSAFVAALAAAILLELRLLLAEDVSRELRLELARIAGRNGLDRLDHPTFHHRLRVAHEAITARVDALPWAVVGTGMGLLGSIAIAVVLIRLAPLVLAVMVVASLPLLVVARFKSRVLCRFRYDHSADDRRRLYLEEMLTERRSAPELIAHGARPELQRRIEALFDQRRRQVDEVYRRRRPAVVGATMASTVGLALSLVMIIALIDRGSLALADAAVAAIAVNQLRGRLTSITLGVEDIHQGAALLAVVDELRAETPRLVQATRSAAPLERLVVDDVRFTYPGADRPTLRGVDLEIRRGQIVALVGENGSGKTTLAKLLSGLYPPSSGRLWWNGRAMGDEGGEPLPSVAHLFQDFNRYELSVLDNITLGDPDRPVDRARAAEAARVAGAHRWIEDLPDGYDTIVSRSLADGTELSGGQWQRLALARALYRRSPLVILDEPTAAQDPLQEAGFLDRLRPLTSESAVLVISHRLSVVRGADAVAVLDDGRVVEHGTNLDLEQASGHYHALFRRELDRPRTPSLVDR